MCLEGPDVTLDAPLTTPAAPPTALLTAPAAPPTPFHTELAEDIQTELVDDNEEEVVAWAFKPWPCPPSTSLSAIPLSATDEIRARHVGEAKVPAQKPWRQHKRIHLAPRMHA
jgi:hypothetical protein